MSSENPFFILVAEDDPDDQDILQILLDTHFPQWHYHIVNNGQLLINYLSNKTEQPFPVSLVLIDINMPVKDGIETLKSLRTMIEYKYLPVVAFSTSGNKWMEDTFMKAGGNAYLQKPDKLEQMVYVLSQLPELIKKTGNK
ncbi:response regulator [Cytophagaceae bacterium DM2B3-1]|uniref:Response regulator n=1 Tax=Xanthocytophaga flava TaxID=3048013 RepID=A0ABT7CHC4_9BACT|nr:response regulator [Xanthocytophaga flavus]MDJ1493143.1 response regulator [Xanthocytophaga flavus]